MKTKQIANHPTNQNETRAAVAILERWLFWENVIVVFAVAAMLMFASSGRADVLPAGAQVLESRTQVQRSGQLARVRHVVLGEDLVRVEDSLSPSTQSELSVSDYSRFRVHMKEDSVGGGFAQLSSTLRQAGATMLPTEVPEIFEVTYREKSLSLQEKLRKKIRSSTAVKRLEAIAKAG